MASRSHAQRGGARVRTFSASMRRTKAGIRHPNRTWTFLPQGPAAKTCCAPERTGAVVRSEGHWTGPSPNGTPKARALGRENSRFTRRRVLWQGLQNRRARGGRSCASATRWSSFCGQAFAHQILWQPGRRLVIEPTRLQSMIGHQRTRCSKECRARSFETHTRGGRYAFFGDLGPRQAFSKLSKVVPPTPGIVHQVTLGTLARVVVRLGPADGGKPAA